MLESQERVAMTERTAEVLIVGGGVGGCAAAMAATSMGLKVILTEETDWLGGQLTAQAVPPDEHPWIEQCGCTARYRAFREGVRQFYREHYPLSAEARQNRRLNPGGGWVSRLCIEPRVALAVLDQMFAWPRTTGRLQVLLEHRPVAAEAEGDRVRSVTLQDSRSGNKVTVRAPFVIDATETGELLPLAGVEYVSGAESQDETGEPHAVSGPAQPENLQAITWCFPMAHDPTPGANHVIDKPATYGHWRDYVPNLTPAWPGRLISWDMTHPITLEKRTRMLFPGKNDQAWESLWSYRRIITSKHYAESENVHEVSLVNWPQNDYLEFNIIDKPADQVAKALQEAKDLSLSLFYWMQTEAPRPDGGSGYPGLYLRPDLTGTPDGLAKYPYIRESRRIKALFTVTERHIGAEYRKAEGFDRATEFKDSVGVGAYRIDLHPSTGGDNYIDISSYPFQIPLGSLIPQRVENLLPACKNLGVTHLSNGCYRVHPAEWNIGESAGLLAAYCLTNNRKPHEVHADEKLLEDFQNLLIQQGVELAWPDPARTAL